MEHLRQELPWMVQVGYHESQFEKNQLLLSTRTERPSKAKPQEKQITIAVRVLDNMVDPRGELSGFQDSMKESMLSDNLTESHVSDLSLWIAKLHDGISSLHTSERLLVSHLQDCGTELSLLREKIKECEEMRQKALHQLNQRHRATVPQETNDLRGKCFNEDDLAFLAQSIEELKQKKRANSFLASAVASGPVAATPSRTAEGSQTGRRFVVVDV